MDDHTTVQCKEVMCRHNIYHAADQVRWLREVHPEEERQKVLSCERQYCQDYQQQYHDSACVQSQWDDVEDQLSPSSPLSFLTSRISIDVQYVYIKHTDVDYWNMNLLPKEKDGGAIRQLVLHIEQEVAKRCEELCGNRKVIYHTTKCSLAMDPESWIVTIALDGYLVAPSTCVLSLTRENKLGLENSYLEYEWMDDAQMYISFTPQERAHLALAYQQYRCFQELHEHVRRMMRWKFSRSRHRYLSVETENLLKNVDQCLEALQWCGRYLIEGTDFVGVYKRTLKRAWHLLQDLSSSSTPIVKLEPMIHRLDPCQITYKSSEKNRVVELDFSGCCQPPPTAEQLKRLLEQNIENQAADADISHRSGYSTMTHQLLRSDVPQFLLQLHQWVSSYAADQKVIRRTRQSWWGICDLAQTQEYAEADRSTPEELQQWRMQDRRRWSERASAAAGSHWRSDATCEDLADRDVQQLRAFCADSSQGEAPADCEQWAARYRENAISLCRLQKDKPVLADAGMPDDRSALHYLAQYDC